MKKAIICFILILCFILTACTNQKMENDTSGDNLNQYNSNNESDISGDNLNQQNPYKDANVSGDIVSNNTNFTDNDKINIVTSFYPIYLAVCNIVDGVENVTLSNMTNTNVGCLHDYQLTTRDMNVLEKADIFIINGLRYGSFFR